MQTLSLIGIGTGNPDHLTVEAQKALAAADLILIPRKGPDKADLADLRWQIVHSVLGPNAPVIEFDLPRRDPDLPYLVAVDRWHDAIAAAWASTMAAAPQARRVALLVWGDPSLYDSSLRIAARLRPVPQLHVVPGITALQVLTAAHGIAINTLAGAFSVTTGRRLAQDGWPEGVESLAVMLDQGGAFQVLDGAAYDIWWGAYLGMNNQLLRAGRLGDVAAEILATRQSARAAHGWIMDIYLLRPVRPAPVSGTD